jgi:hypothetical protein
MVELEIELEFATKMILRMSVYNVHPHTWKYLKYLEVSLSTYISTQILQKEKEEDLDDELCTSTTHVVLVASAYILHKRLHPSLSPSTHAGNLRCPVPQTLLAHNHIDS